MVSMAQGVKRPVWVASGSVVNGVLTFTRPIRYNWHWRALNTSVDMMTFGPDYMDYRKVVTTNKEVRTVQRLDRVWMDRAPSNLDDVFAADADFYVLGVAQGAGGVAEMTFKRLNPDE